MRELCKKHGIYLTAWGPLGTYGEIWGSNLIMENPTLEYIASARGKTVAQVDPLSNCRGIKHLIHYIVLNKA